MQHENRPACAADHPSVEVKPKRTYHPPILEDYGEVRDLTQATSSNPYAFDGVFYFS